MDIDSLKAEGARLFPLATQHSIEHPGVANTALEELKGLCRSHYQELGFDCIASCFNGIVPKLEGELSCIAHCAATLKIGCWQIRVDFRPLYLSESQAHFAIKHRGPLPGVTDTGYRSILVPMSTFIESTPSNFLEALLSKAPRQQQMDLF